jgi:hypothetical protein
MSSPNMSPIRTYDFGSSQYLTTAGAAAVRSAAINQERIVVHAVGAAGFFCVGNDTVTATIGAGSIPLALDEKLHLNIDAGQFVSWIRSGATDGSLLIMGCN